MTRTNEPDFFLPERGALCAVSGGLDSMCLLTMAVQWGQAQGRRVAAAHFNHQLRGGDADRDERFVRVLPAGVGVDIRHVKCSNYCDIQLYADEHTGLLIVTSVIDNMVKGAAGQAIQNMNILFGLLEETGIDMIPPAF